MRVSSAAALTAAAMMSLGLLVIAPTASAASSGLEVSISGSRVVITAGADMTAFADTETLVVSPDKAGVTIVMDEGSARLWSKATGCTSAPEATPVVSITCTGSFTAATIDLSKASVTTQSAVNGTLALTFLGGSGNDGAYGAAGADQILGNAGADDLFGGNADDSIFGGAGSDTVEGELGSDWMYGGPGADDIDAEDDIADKYIDCGSNVGDEVAYDIKLEKPVFCDGPFVSVMHPQAGPQGGAPVTIRGGGLSDLTSASFGGVSAKIVSASDTEAVIISPGGTGAAAVSLQLGALPLRAGTYTYAPPPSLTSVSPTRGGSGTKITLKGTGFSRIYRVIVGGQIANYSTSMSGAIVLTAPTNGRLGAVDITIVTAGGQSTLRNAFRYTP